MNKILTLSTKDWLSGLGTAQNSDEGGIFAIAEGVNPFVDPYIDSSNYGLLQAGSAITDLTGAIVDQNIVHFIPDAPNNRIYALGITGDLYSINPNTDSVALQSALADVTSLQRGWLSTAGGTKYFYYINNSVNIGRWDMAEAYTYNWKTTLQNTIIHPVHYWQRTHWIGDKDRISKVDQDAALTVNVLTLDPEFTVMDLEDDDYRLVIGASVQTVLGSNKGMAKIYFWDGASTLPEKIWNIPETNIMWIKRIGGVFYALCGQSLYVFDYSTPPTKILDTRLAYASQVYSISDSIGDAVLWGGARVLNMYGKLSPSTPKSYSTPFLLSTIVAVSAIDSSSFLGAIFVGTNTAKLYRLSTLSGGGTGATILARTRFIDLKDVYDIQGITVVFGLNLASGDDMNITLTNRNGDVQTINPTYAALGAVARQHYPVTLKADQLQITMGAFTAGNPKVKDVIIYGEKTTEL